jgi:hypothetical protein
MIDFTGYACVNCRKMEAAFPVVIRMAVDEKCCNKVLAPYLKPIVLN